MNDKPVTERDNPATLLVVDDHPDNVALLVDLLQADYRVLAATSGRRALDRARGIPVMFITAINATQDEEHGLELGAVDYITKPIRPAIVLARVRTQLELKRARD